MVGVFGDENLSYRRVGRQPAFDQPGWRRGLQHAVLAFAAGIFGPHGDEHPELCRTDVEPLTPVFANAVQLALAARASLVADIDDQFDPRQMRRQ